MSKQDNFVGLVGLAIGMIGVGYALATRSKMAKISENLERSIDDLASRTPVDIPDSLVHRAIEKSVANEVKQTVDRATNSIICDVKRDIHKQVSDAVENEYSSIKDNVLEELVTAASKIDVVRVRNDIEKSAKEHAMKKLDDNMNDILENFNEQLKNTSRIYNSIADTMTGYKTGGRETVFRIG